MLSVRSTIIATIAAIIDAIFEVVRPALAEKAHASDSGCPHSNENIHLAVAMR